jgi:hypothetical protein
MKVICIDAKPREGDFEDGPFLKEGKFYTVEFPCEGYGSDGEPYPCYSLKEISHPDACFEQDRFIPLSDICEVRKMKQNWLRLMAHSL